MRAEGPTGAPRRLLNAIGGAIEAACAFGDATRRRTHGELGRLWRETKPTTVKILRLRVWV